jgi:hypothetical protein
MAFPRLTQPQEQDENTPQYQQPAAPDWRTNAETEYQSNVQFYPNLSDAAKQTMRMQTYAKHADAQLGTVQQNLQASPGYVRPEDQAFDPGLPLGVGYEGPSSARPGLVNQAFNTLAKTWITNPTGVVAPGYARETNEAMDQTTPQSHTFGGSVVRGLAGATPLIFGVGPAAALAGVSGVGEGRQEADALRAGGQEVSGVREAVGSVLHGGINAATVYAGGKSAEALGGLTNGWIKGVGGAMIPATESVVGRGVMSLLTNAATQPVEAGLSEAAHYGVDRGVFGQDAAGSFTGRVGNAALEGLGQAVAFAPMTFAHAHGRAKAEQSAHQLARLAEHVGPNVREAPDHLVPSGLRWAARQIAERRGHQASFIYAPESDLPALNDPQSKTTYFNLAHPRVLQEGIAGLAFEEGSHIDTQGNDANWATERQRFVDDINERSPGAIQQEGASYLQALRDAGMVEQASRLEASPAMLHEEAVANLMRKAATGPEVDRQFAAGYPGVLRRTLQGLQNVLGGEGRRRLRVNEAQRQDVDFLRSRIEQALGLQQAESRQGIMDDEAMLDRMEPQFQQHAEQDQTLRTADEDAVLNAQEDAIVSAKMAEHQARQDELANAVQSAPVEGQLPGRKGTVGASESPDRATARYLRKNAANGVLPLKGRQAGPTPNDEARSHAAEYVKEAGIPAPRRQRYAKLDESVSRSIAEWYDKAPDQRNDPAVRDAYRAMADETKAQWDHLVRKGVKFEAYTGEGQPYADSRAMMADVRDNKHLYFFPSDAGFGQDQSNADHPLMQPAGVKDANGRELVYNDIFRAVHDYYGHAKEGVGFGPRGEENAWLSHSQMYTEAARRAMSAETRGQNSWVNFGPHGEHNRANPQDTRYAEQKVLLMPREFTNPPEHYFEPESKSELPIGNKPLYAKPVKFSVYRNGRYEKGTAYENPKPEELHNLLETSRYGEVRGFVKGGKTYVWDGDFGTHDEVHMGLGDSTPRGLFPDQATFYVTSHGGKVKFSHLAGGKVMADPTYRSLYRSLNGKPVAENKFIGQLYAKPAKVSEKVERKKPLTAASSSYMNYAHEGGVHNTNLKDVELWRLKRGADEVDRIPALTSAGRKATHFDDFPDHYSKSDLWGRIDHNAKIVTVASQGEKATPEELERIDGFLSEHPDYQPLLMSDRANLYAKPVKGDPDTLSTRIPTAKRALEDPFGEVPLVVDFDTLKREPHLLVKQLGAVRQMPNVPHTDYRLPPVEAAERFVNHVRDNLLWLHDNAPAVIREQGHKWYEGANKLAKQWAAEYGKPDRAVAATIAVLSPQKDWQTNVTLARRVMDTLTYRQHETWTPQMQEVAERIYQSNHLKLLHRQVQGKRLRDLSDPVQKAAWIRAYDQAHNDRSYPAYRPDGSTAGTHLNDSGKTATAAWGSMDAMAKAVRAFENPTHENISANLGWAHKVRNFYNNIIAPNDPNGHVTIDTHAVAAGLMRPLSGESREVSDNLGAGPSSEFSGIVGTYPLYAEAYRRAAAERDILPRQMQSITWEAVRGLYTKQFKQHQKAKINQIEGVWQRFKKGEVTREQAVEASAEIAGGFSEPDWARAERNAAEGQRQSGAGLDAEERGARDQGELPPGQLPGRDSARGRGRVGDSAAVPGPGRESLLRGFRDAGRAGDRTLYARPVRERRAFVHYSVSPDLAEQGIRRQFAGTGATGQEGRSYRVDKRTGKTNASDGIVFLYLPGAQAEPQVMSRSKFRTEVQADVALLDANGQEAARIKSSIPASVKGERLDREFRKAVVAAGYDGIEDRNRRSAMVQLFRDVTPEEVAEHRPMFEKHPQYKTKVSRSIADSYAKERDALYAKPTKGNTFSLANENLLQTLQRKVQDEFAPVARVQRDVSRQGGTVPPEANVYRKLELYKDATGDRLARLDEDYTKPLQQHLKATKVSPDDLDAYLAGKGPGSPAIQKAAQYLYDANREVLAHEVASGLLNSASPEYLKRAGDWVPQRADMFDVNDPDAPAADTPSAFAVQYLKRRLVEAEQNKVRLAALELVRKNPDAKLWEVDPATPGRREQTVRLMDAGKPTSIKFLGEAGKRFARALNRIDNGQGNEVIRVLSRAMRAYAGLQTTLNPEFLIPNIFRDATEAGLGLTASNSAAFARRTLTKMPRAAKAMWDVLGDRKRGTSPMHNYAREYMAAGGKVDPVQVGDFEAIARQMRRGLQEPGPARKAARAVADTFLRLGTAAEQATRLATYATAREAGHSVEESASMAKNVTVNFDRKGEWGRTINTLYLFANANIQGNANLLRRVATTNRGRALGGGVLAAGFAAGAVLPALFGKDEDGRNKYDRIPDHVKETNLVFPLPGNDYGKIPLPYGFGAIFNAGRQLAEAASGRKSPGKAALSTITTGAQAFNPLGNEGSLLQLLSPTVTDPIVQVQEGKDFAGNNLYPANYGNKPDSQLARRDTSAAAKAVAEWVNDVTGGNKHRPGGVDVSPITLDHWVDFAVGGAGRAAEKAARTATGNARGPQDVPVVSRFAGSRSTDSVRYQEFHEAKQESAGTEWEAYANWAERQANQAWRRIFVRDYRAGHLPAKWRTAWRKKQAEERQASRRK